MPAALSSSIVDEGVNYLHADLVGTYNTAIDYDPRGCVGDNDAHTGYGGPTSRHRKSPA